MVRRAIFAPSRRLTTQFAVCTWRFHRWESSGIMNQIYRLLYQDLRDRAGIDMFQALKVENSVKWDRKSAPGESSITLSRGDCG